MKDDKFNRLMEQYVDSTKRGQESDLQKLRDRKEEIRVKKSKPVLVWVACTVVLVLVISLSIILPLVPNNKEKVQKNYYCDALNINKIPVEQFSDLKEKHQFSCLLPTVSLIDEPYIYLMSEKESNEVFGAFIDVVVYDEHFDGITFNIIKKPYELIQLQYFKDFREEVVWNNVIVKYKIGDDDYDGYYNYAITFSIDSYEYFITFDSYCIMTATQALDYIYN